MDMCDFYSKPEFWGWCFIFVVVLTLGIKIKNGSEQLEIQYFKGLLIKHTTKRSAGDELTALQKTAYISHIIEPGTTWTIKNIWMNVDI